MVRSAAMVLVLVITSACEGEITPDGPPQIELGELPAEMSIRWPELPSTDTEVEVRSAAEFDAAASVPGTRILVRSSFTESIFVRASDIDIVVDDGVALGRLLIEKELSRIRVTGGHWESIELQVPAQFFPGPEEWRREWLITDVLIDSVEVDASDTAFLLRGVRVAVVRSRAHAVRYSVWCGETADFQSEDVILASNTFSSDGPEATVRLVSVLRSVTVDNRLENTEKHNYRVHGHSDLSFAARNTLVTTGVMLGTMPGDDLGRVWFNDNVLHHRSPSLFLADEGIDALETRGNLIYTDAAECFVCMGTPSGWLVEANEMLPYQPPPQ